MPHTTLRAQSRSRIVSLPLSGECPLAEANQLDGSLHGILRLHGAGVNGVDFRALHVTRECEADGVTFDGACKLRFSKLARVVARELFAILLEDKRRRPRAGACLD